MHWAAPSVSIITPAYRCADTLAFTLKSLIRQSLGEWESIIVDDGSPDDSIATARDFALRDSRFRVLTQANAGACAARNTGIAAACGRFVLFLDADDWMEPAALAAMVEACQRKSLAAVHGAFRYAKADGTPTQWMGAYDGGEPLFNALASSNVLSLPSCVMLRRSLLDDIGGFDISLRHCGDWDLWARVARSDVRIGRIDDVVTGYRMRPTSLSRNPLTLLRDASTVLDRIHGRDARVQRPNRQHAHGASRDQLSDRLAAFTFYSATLAAMLGDRSAALEAMNTIVNWPCLAPMRIAEFLLHAACFSRCTGPDDLRPLPAAVREVMDAMVRELEWRTHEFDLRNRVENALTLMGYGRQNYWRTDRARLERPRTSADTLASEYLRSLALRECVMM